MPVESRPGWHLARMFEFPRGAAGIRRLVQRVLHIEIYPAAASHSPPCRPRAAKVGGCSPLMIRRRCSNLVCPKSRPVTGGLGPGLGAALEAYPLLQE